MFMAGICSEVLHSVEFAAVDEFSGVEQLFGWDDSVEREQALVLVVDG